MIKHIVAFKLKDTNKEDNLQSLKSKLERLPEVIPGVMNFETGKNISNRSSAYDLVLISEFASLNDLDMYRNHPEHIKVLDIIQQVVDNTVVVDYEI
jgi:antibiotic biosynthesis monooxygenase (ABM) superfamily enzyme